MAVNQDRFTETEIQDIYDETITNIYFLARYTKFFDKPDTNLSFKLNDFAVGDEKLFIAALLFRIRLIVGGNSHCVHFFVLIVLSYNLILGILLHIDIFNIFFDVSVCKFET